jgi:hypothetical protein
VQGVGCGVGTEHAGVRYGVRLGKGCSDVHTYAHTLRDRDSERDRIRHTLARWRLKTRIRKDKNYTHIQSLLAVALLAVENILLRKQLHLLNSHCLLDLADSLTDHCTDECKRVSAPAASPAPIPPPFLTSRTCAADDVPIRSARCGR